jgi:hypothetical protein
MVLLWLAFYVLGCLLWVKADDWAFGWGCKSLMLFNLNIMPKRIWESAFCLGGILFCLLYDIRVACGWLSRSRIFCCESLWVRWFLFDGALKWIERKWSMHFALGYVRLWIAILRFKVDDLLLLLFHQIERVFEFGRWIIKWDTFGLHNGRKR